MEILHCQLTRILSNYAIYEKSVGTTYCSTRAVVMLYSIGLASYLSVFG